MQSQGTSDQGRREDRSLDQGPAGPAPPARGGDPTPEFEQMLKKPMRQSEERLVDYKRAVEHKRK